MPATRISLAENPWLWVALFGGVGLLGVIVIAPKFNARMSRVERMQETRERIAIERAQRQTPGPAAVNSEVPPAVTSTEGKPTEDKPTEGKGTGGTGIEAELDREPYVESDFRPSTSLRYLLALMTFVMLVGTAGLVVSRASQRRAAGESAAAATSSSESQERPQS